MKNTRFRVQSFPFGPTSFLFFFFLSKLSSPLHSFCHLTKGCPSNGSIPLGLNKNKQAERYNFYLSSTAKMLDFKQNCYKKKKKKSISFWERFENVATRDMF
jgi:hypothetical protein